MGDTPIFVSIDDERAKAISEVITNKSCRKIISYLENHDATVSDIARELDIPINTADYNMKKLLKAGLIEKKSFFWSTRGKKMPTYTTSHQNIVITPRRSVPGISYLLLFIATALLALLIKGFAPTPDLTDAESFAFKAAIVEDAESSALALTAPRREATIQEETNQLWLWFLGGAWISIFLFFIINSLLELRRHHE